MKILNNLTDINIVYEHWTDKGKFFCMFPSNFHLQQCFPTIYTSDWETLVYTQTAEIVFWRLFSKSHFQGKVKVLGALVRASKMKLKCIITHLFLSPKKSYHFAPKSNMYIRCLKTGHSESRFLTLFHTTSEKLC